MVILIEQGDILNVESLTMPVLIVSKDIFNQNDQVICCPIVKICSEDPLHHFIKTEDIQGYVLCEHLKFLDLRIRGYKKISSVSIEDIIDITDSIQSIFDYY